VDAQGQALRIVHRDVSPENVLVSWAGDVKLSDFGIALAEGRLEKTADGVMKGKLAYMAPEQATGGAVDARADVFSLGCVLHMLVAGDSPLARDTALAQLLGGGELDLAPELPDDLRPIIAQAVRRSRYDRYASASAMAEAMSAALRGRLTGDVRIAVGEWMAQVRPPRTAAPEPVAQPKGGDEWIVLSEQDEVAPTLVKDRTSKS
jgi:serine/threonine protein kinase